MVIRVHTRLPAYQRIWGIGLIQTQTDHVAAIVAKFAGGEVHFPKQDLGCVQGHGETTFFPLLLRDISSKSDTAHHRAGIVKNRRLVGFKPPLRTLGIDDHLFDVLLFSGSEHGPVVGSIAFGQVGWRNIEVIFANHVVGAALTEQRHEPLVDCEKTTLRVLEPDSEGKVVEQGALVLFALLQLTLFLSAIGDVLTSRQATDDVAVRVSDRAVVPGDQALFATARTHRVFVVFRTRLVARQRLLEHRAHLLDIHPARQAGSKPVLTDQLVFAVAQDLTALAVDQRDVPLRI